MQIEERRLSISLSIGIAYYPKTAHSVSELLKQADEEMYCAKQSGKANYFHFSESLQQEYERRRQLEALLPKAVNHGELELAYHPIVNASDHSLHSLEVLSRWNLQGFTVSAAELISMVERLNLFDEFHDWLVATAFNQCAQWQLLLGDVRFCLNIPANYAHSEWLLHCLRRAFDVYNVKPPQIALEITESTLMNEPDISSRMLSRLQDQGVQIAIDDFVTGYSSMAYLTTLPLNVLKIDQYFVQHVDQDARSRKVVEGITALGHSLSLQVVAEGIETESQYHAVKDIGCDLLQGLYVGQPHSVACDSKIDAEGFLMYFPELNGSAIEAKEVI